MGEAIGNIRKVYKEVCVGGKFVEKLRTVILPWVLLIVWQKWNNVQMGFWICADVFAIFFVWVGIWKDNFFFFYKEQCNKSSFLICFLRFSEQSVFV